MSARRAARHLLSRALGVLADPAGVGCDCVVCGPAAPFAAAGPAARALGVGFSDWAACDAPSAPSLCAGCARVLAGRPGDDPPPLRTRSVAVIADRLVLPAPDAMWTYLVAPPPELRVLSWATSKQRHHVLYAEVSTPEHLRVGSDLGTIDVRPDRDQALAEAVLTLRAADEAGKAWCTRDAILSGAYHASTLARGGAQAWARAEAVIAPRRGDPVLALLVAHAPVVPVVPSSTCSPEGPADMLDDLDTTASVLLATLARDSQYRITHGKEFWGGVFQRRIRRHAGRPLATFVSRMLADLEVPPIASGAREAVQQGAALDDATQRALMTRLRERTTLLVALAFEHQTAAKEAAKSRRSSPSPLTLGDLDA